jgi:parvulin-like peptidyl-prolyl isomerase
LSQAAAVALAIGLAACQSQSPPPPPVKESPVATVNGEAISREAFQSKMAEETALMKREDPLKAEQMALLKEEVLNRLIEELCMLQRARASSLTVSRSESEARIAEIRKDYGNGDFSSLFGDGKISVDAWKQALEKRMVLEKLIDREVNAAVQVTDEEAERYYTANRKIYQSERRVRAAQIVVRDRERAEEILKRLKRGEDFGKVAREASIGPEAAKEGDLGYFERGMMPETIDRVIFSVPVGKVSGVVQSPYGFHIIKVLESQQGGSRTFAEAKERVREDLRKMKEAETYERWLEGLKAESAIVINRPLPDDSPAEQARQQRDKVPGETGKH